MKLIFTLLLILPQLYSCDTKKGRDPASLREKKFEGVTSGRGIKYSPPGEKSEEEGEDDQTK